MSARVQPAGMTTTIVMVVLAIVIVAFAGYGVYSLATTDGGTPQASAQASPDASRGPEDDEKSRLAEVNKEKEEAREAAAAARREAEQEAREAKEAEAAAAAQREAEQKAREAKEAEAKAAAKEKEEKKKAADREALLEEQRKAAEIAKEAEEKAKKLREAQEKAKKMREEAREKMASEQTAATKAAQKDSSSGVPVKNTLVAKYSLDMNTIREKFNENYKPSDFSNDFLADGNLSALLQELSGIDLGNLNLTERIIAFIITHDAKTGYPKDPDKRQGALQEARREFKRTVSRKADNEAWDRRMKVVNEGLQTHCPDMVRKRESYVQPEDMTRAEGADRIRTRMAATMRCRVFNTPRAFTNGTVAVKSMKETTAANTSIDWDAITKVCDCSFGTNMKEIPGKCIVPQPKAARGYLAGTPVMYYNVRDIDKDRPMPKGGF